MSCELIVALDVPTAKDAASIVDALPIEVKWFKVGLELFTSEGPGALDCLKKKRKKIFLDLKLHDIPNTVAGAVVSAGKHGVAMLTVHAGGGRAMLEAAATSARALGGAAPKLVAVTALTSLGQGDLDELGVSRPLADHIMALGELAIASGIDGLVCSPNEASKFREKLGWNPIIVTPGIRPAGTEVGDQKRVATPATAVKAGASFIVVGRPILQASDPSAAASAILAEIRDAQEQKLAP